MDENNFENNTSENNSFENNTFESGTFESGTYESNTFDSNNYESGTSTYTQPTDNAPKTGSKALEICALVFGVLGIVCCICYGLFGVIGLILSIICLATGKKSGLSIAGLVCSILGVILTVIMFAIGLNSQEIIDKLQGSTTETEITEFELTTDEMIPKEEDLTEEDTEVADTEEENTTEAAAPAPVDGLSDIYADLDNRSFAINGKVYTLGVTTLQEMIDDGVPFDTDDIANANNNLNANSSSAGFKIVLGEYYSAQVYVGNFTDDNKSAAECPICEIYLPVDLEESNDILQFAFPLTMTEEELVANSGEPTDKDEYTSDDGTYQSNTYEYKVDSEQYIGDSGYRFEFANGELSYVYIDLK